jgi:putative tricarboxylic transport membrane protein
MDYTADRASGAFFLLFGLAMYFFVIPNYVETAEGGNIAPNTLPNIISVIIAVCGGILVLKPTRHMVRDPRQMAVTGMYVALLAAGIYAMSLFGFEFVAPVLAFAIMWLIGERRPLWLVSGTVIMPAVIWFIVTNVLGRALP